MKAFTFLASINALEERVDKIEAILAANPSQANYDQEEETQEEEEPEE